jgi:glycosyltransferase involved in cell wall biosynthesis
MIYLVSAKVPPEYSGAGKLINDFYNFLKRMKIGVKLITHTAERGNQDIISIDRFQSKFNKTNVVIEFAVSLFNVFKIVSLQKKKNNQTGLVWLVSTNPLTFAAALVFKYFGYKIITQNTLVGSDDPAHRYAGDVLGMKFFLKKAQYKLSDKVTCISPALFKVTECFHRNCCMIPYPVNLYNFKEKKSLKREKKLTILFVGALCYRKGLDIVFKTIDRIHLKEPDIIFNLVGSEIGYTEELQRLFEKLDNIVTKNVIFAGMQQDVLPWYENADLLFFPSRREGFGLVFIEAMACGLPVVAKKIEGITDYIFNDEYDSIMDTEDPDKYAGTILDLLTDNHQYQRLSKLGLDLVKRFDEDKIFNRYLGLVNDSLKPGKVAL